MSNDHQSDDSRATKRSLSPSSPPEAMPGEEVVDLIKGELHDWIVNERTTVHDVAVRIASLLPRCEAGGEWLSSQIFKDVEEDRRDVTLGSPAMHHLYAIAVERAFAEFRQNLTEFDAQPAKSDGNPRVAARALSPSDGVSDVPCRFGCEGAVGIYLVPKGCVCWDDPVQALCQQHATKAESEGPIRLIARPFGVREISPAPEGWRPIETAPKDGTLFDVWCEATTSGAISRRYTDCRYRKMNWGLELHPDGASWGFPSCHHPTHWMPLPTPPASEQKDLGK